MRVYLRDADGCPVGEICGYDPDGFPEGEFWGATNPVEGWDDDDQVDDVPDPTVPASEEDPEDYGRLFEPPVDNEGDEADSEQGGTTR